ncbi:MAG: hypothetical protein Q9179_005110 [Wetmoreana sp. 5 TL-2023]
MVGHKSTGPMGVEDGTTAGGRGRGTTAARVARAGRTTRGRGRGQAGEVAQEYSVVVPSEVFNPPEASRSRSRSPSKRGKTLDKTKADPSIDMVYLGACTPSVRLETREVAMANGSVPPMVLELESALMPPVTGFIPSSLIVSDVLYAYLQPLLSANHEHIQPLYEDEADTPRKSRLAPRLHEYLPDTDLNIPADFRQSVKATVEQVVRATARNTRLAAHERQWGLTTVAPLINEVLKWPQSQGAIALNVENCPIDPLDIRMIRPDGHPFKEETKTKSSTIDDTEVTTTRMVDISLGLELDTQDTSLVNEAWKTKNDYEHSLNQSMAYIRSNPLFLDLELKSLNQNRDPVVQLGIWMAGLYEKRKHHGWDTSVPMPGLLVAGHDWKFYLGFVRGGGVVIMQSSKLFGSTADTAGTFEIIYKLNILVQ